MPTIALNGGGHASYEVIGHDGRSLLLLPGGPGFSAAVMRPDAKLFVDRCRAYLIDPPGSGGSVQLAANRDLTPAGHAGWYADVLDRLGVSGIDVLGHSFGGLVALSMAAARPELVRTCVCVSAPFVGVEVDTGDGESPTNEAALSRHADKAWYPLAREAFDSWTDVVLTTDDVTEVERLNRLLLPLYVAEPDRADVREALEQLGQASHLDLEAMKVWESGLYQRIDMRPVLPKVKTPVLIVAGDLDWLAGPQQARIGLQLLPQAEASILPNCGHIPAIEAPDKYRAAVYRWWTEHP